jgi:hypothetical protein
VFVLELSASDLHAVLGRLLDHARVAGLRFSTVSAAERDSQYVIRASVDTRDRDSIDKLVRKVSAIVGVAEIAVKQEHAREAETLLAV